MKLEKGKLFRSSTATLKRVCSRKWEESTTEYYSFIKSCKNEGYRQIIISSEIFIKLIEYFVIQLGFSIVKIEFMEDDDEFSKNISILILNMEKDRAFYSDLQDQLRSISEKSSVEIKRVTFKRRNISLAERCFIQSNGVIGVNQESFDTISEQICTCVEECIFG